MNQIDVNCVIDSAKEGYKIRLAKTLETFLLEFFDSSALQVLLSRIKMSKYQVTISDTSDPELYRITSDLVKRFATRNLISPDYLGLEIYYKNNGRIDFTITNLQVFDKHMRDLEAIKAAI